MANYNYVHTEPSRVLPTLLLILKNQTASCIVAIALLGVGLFQIRGAAQSNSNPAQLTFTQDGQTFDVVDGDVYQVTLNAGRTFVAHLYDPNFFQKNFKTLAGVLLRQDPGSKKLYQMTRTFREGFEGAASVDALFTAARWHTNTADPKHAGQQDNYYNLGDRISLSKTVIRSGTAALKCYAVPSATSVSKASISKGLMYFKKGDEVYFSGWFFIEPTPSIYDAGGFTLFDLESTFLVGSPGMRIIFGANDALNFELKLPKTEFKQVSGSEVRFPTGRWVKVETRTYLSDEAGRVQIWQDGLLVLDKMGRTLPLADTVYDRFEVGISGIAQGSKYTKGVYVDDVAISDRPIL